jgi:hypothetical protein
MFVHRIKYYIPWKLSSAAVVICGLSYKYETPNPSLDSESNKTVSPHKFDKVLNVVIHGVEWEVDPKNRIRVNIFFYLF